MEKRSVIGFLGFSRRLLCNETQQHSLFFDDSTKFIQLVETQYTMRTDLAIGQKHHINSAYQIEGAKYVYFTHKQKYTFFKEINTTDHEALIQDVIVFIQI